MKITKPTNFWLTNRSDCIWCQRKFWNRFRFWILISSFVFWVQIVSEFRLSDFGFQNFGFQFSVLSSMFRLFLISKKILDWFLFLNSDFQFCILSSAWRWWEPSEGSEGPVWESEWTEWSQISEGKKLNSNKISF